MILSAKMLLEWLHGKHRDPSLLRAARRIDAAIERTLTEGKYLTADVGGTASTEEAGEAIAEACTTTEIDHINGKG
jgi:3-isopropylmalate dehydrogenase